MNNLMTNDSITKPTTIILLAMANGDVYENVIYEGTVKELKHALKEREFINVKSFKKDIVINSEFVLSFEL
ncbi:hypothetical protein [Vallitalea sp.]|jgi:hypothetical protein|uniref:hypothetical protein n=1 Tax=Vallitalea sp. TaxID=1882829 RepID=UPI0025D455F9|nr:hypothetical protein [Vallitalea sp.]MCT4685933.1 hypothetical protein [Vallitalea sp.]